MVGDLRAVGLVFYQGAEWSIKQHAVILLPGDQLAIAKETGRRLGMGINMYPSSSLLGQHKDESIASLPVDELIEKADGFAGVFPGLYITLAEKFLSLIRVAIYC